MHRIVEPELAAQTLMGANSRSQLCGWRAGLGKSEEHSGIGEELSIGRPVFGSMGPLCAVVKREDVVGEYRCHRAHVHLTHRG